jgi:hypothetical protein
MNGRPSYHARGQLAPLVCIAGRLLVVGAALQWRLQQRREKPQLIDSAGTAFRALTVAFVPMALAGDFRSPCAGARRRELDEAAADLLDCH